MRLLRRFLGQPVDDAIHVTDQRILDRFLKNPDFPWLISFPRTGSHWLRMIMELYFEKPSLRRIFFFSDATDFTCYHWHDVDLATADVKSVIYLYRYPVDTIYSQLRYHKEDVQDAERVRHWSVTYARHLSKWLFDETFTKRKTVVRYEGLQRDAYTEFEKVCTHLDQPFDPAQLDAAMSRVSKSELKEKTQHDKQIVNLSTEYASEKEAFRGRFGALILELTARENPLVGELWSAGETG
jgi:Sulfotransferase family